MSRYRAGVVGLSWITSEPAKPGTHPVLGPATPHSHLSALANIPSVEVVGACDISQAACDLFRERWLARWPAASTYLDYREILTHERLDLLCVATPDDLHAEVVIAAAEAGVRAIFCEKPMAHRLADADAMISVIERHGVTVSVNHTRRWMPSYVAAREAIRRGEIGPLSQIVVQFGGPRAMLWRNHSHFLDLIGYFAEGSPSWVIADFEPGFEEYGTVYRGDGGRSPELEPGLNAYICYDNGVRAFLGGMKRSVQQVSVDLVGADARIFVNDQRAELIRVDERGVTSMPILPAGTLGGMQAALLDLLRALETGEPPQCPPREARKTIALIEAILASQAAGNARIAVG